MTLRGAKMWMIVMVMATTASLNSTLLMPDLEITTELIWHNKSECDLVREAQLSKHPAPENGALVCLLVPDFIAEMFSPTRVPELTI